MHATVQGSLRDRNIKIHIKIEILYYKLHKNTWVD